MISTLVSAVSASSNTVDQSASSFQNPLLVAIWVIVGVAGLIAGAITVAVAERRLKASASPVVASAAEAELLKTA